MFTLFVLQYTGGILLGFQRIFFSFWKVEDNNLKIGNRRIIYNFNSVIFKHSKLARIWKKIPTLPLGLNWEIRPMANIEQSAYIRQIFDRLNTILRYKNTNQTHSCYIYYTLCVLHNCYFNWPWLDLIRTQYLGSLKFGNSFCNFFKNLFFVLFVFFSIKRQIKSNRLRLRKNWLPVHLCYKIWYAKFIGVEN